MKRKECREVEARFDAGEVSVRELFEAYYDFYDNLFGNKRFRALLEKKGLKPIK